MRPTVLVQPLLLLCLLASTSSAARLPWPLSGWHWGSPAADQQILQAPTQAHPDALLSQTLSHAVQLPALGSQALPKDEAAPAGGALHPISLTDARVATVWSLASPQLLPRLGEEGDGSPGLDMTLAMLAGRLTSAAYCRVPEIVSWDCSRCRDVDATAKMLVYSVIFDAAWDLTAYVGFMPNLDGGTITVSFKGTDSSSIANWMRNLQSWRLDKAWPMPEAPHALIHIGFYNMWHYSALEANVTAAVGQLLTAHPGSGLLVTGHSMGGALAQLCALDMKFNFTGLRSVKVFTFGAPRVGNQAYTDLFRDAVDESWRFTHNRDIVPSLPPLLVGFHHVAREVWLVDVETESGAIDFKVLMCDDSGEDPSCHNSACYFGICTSIADHLTYLGLHMYHNDNEC